MKEVENSLPKKYVTPLALLTCMQHSGTRRNRDYTAVFRNKKEPGAFSLHRGLPGGGVYDCNTYEACGQTSWFLPVNSLFPPHKTSKTVGSVFLYLSRVVLVRVSQLSCSSTCNTT